MQELVLELLNTQAAQTIIIAGLIYLFGKLTIKVPSIKVFYDKYKGEMARIVKLVEVEIPDNTNNKSLHRLDLALQYVIQLIETKENRKLSDAEVLEVRSAISEVHLEVQASGGLNKKA